MPMIFGILSRVLCRFLDFADVPLEIRTQWPALGCDAEPLSPAQKPDPTGLDATFNL